MASGQPGTSALAFLAIFANGEAKTKHLAMVATIIKKGGADHDNVRTGAGSGERTVCRQDR